MSSEASPVAHAVGLGVRRGWLEFVQSVRSTQDQGFYVFTALLTLGYLWIRRDSDSGVPGVPFAAVALPSLLAALIVFGIIIGPAYTIAMEKEDGTLLRHRAVPHGLVGYFSGQLLYQSLNLGPQLVVVLVPSLLLFDGLVVGASGWLTVLWVIVLGLLAALPIGMLIGALVPSVQKVGMWGMLPVLVLTAISGIFYPLQQLWVWVQWLAQVFPLYWVGLGMRSAFLPDAAAAVEVGGSWRTLETVAVLGAWAVLGAVLMPRVLRRMSRRQTGSQVQAAREATLQWVR
ncbi:ABC transporter permease [Microlunatus lacustris]